MIPPFPQGTIYSFDPKTPHFFLSNFYSCSVTYEGITYPTTEHAYQAAKSLDEDIRMLIMRSPRAADAKKMGGSITLRSDWSEVKIPIMEELLLAKFSAGSNLEQRLWKTADAPLIEGNYWHDKFWGQCFCHRHNWEGENHLGVLLMEIRSNIQGLEMPNANIRNGVSSIFSRL